MDTHVQLETDRLLLRKIIETDLDDFLVYRSDPQVAKYQGWEPFNRETALEYLLNYIHAAPNIPGEWFMLGIIHKQDGRLIGDCSIKPNAEEPRNAEIGCSLATSYQRQGYAKEALSALIHYAFAELNLHRIIGITDTRNQGSIHLLNSLGFRKEGHFIQNIFFKGVWGDEYLFACLQEEWMRKSQKL